MRYLFVAILSLFFVSAYGQDSTEIKLQRYKDLRSKDLISEEEYQILKGKELAIQKAQPKKDTVDLKKLERTYKAQIITGTLELAAVPVLLGFFVHLRNEPGFYTNGHYITSIREARICLAASAVFAGIGIYSVTKGAKNRQKYIEISASPGAVTMLMKF